MSSFKAGKGSNYEPGTRRSTTIRGSTMHKESAGVETGLSSRSDLDCDSVEPKLDYERDSMTGNATERMKQNPRKTSGSHHGENFEIC